MLLQLAVCRDRKQPHVICLAFSCASQSSFHMKSVYAHSFGMISTCMFYVFCMCIAPLLAESAGSSLNVMGVHTQPWRVLHMHVPCVLHAFLHHWIMGFCMLPHLAVCRQKTAHMSFACPCPLLSCASRSSFHM